VGSASVGTGVGAGCGAAVGSALGAAVGSALGAVVGTSGGTSVGTGSGTSVGTAVGSALGAMVGGSGTGAVGGGRLVGGAGCGLGAAVGEGCGRGNGLDLGVPLGVVMVGNRRFQGPNVGSAGRASGVATAGIALGADTGVGAASAGARINGGGSTRILLRSLSGAAFVALTVAVLVQSPGPLAVNVTRMAPPWPGLMVPMVRVKLAGVKHPPVETSVITTPVAGTGPTLP
jgi:hypothetical protein